MARPNYVLQAAFASSPDVALDSQVWTDIAPYLDTSGGVTVNRGRTDEFGEIEPSSLSLVLDNSGGRFTPDNTASPYYPNVKTGKMIRLGLMYPGNGKQVYDGDPSFDGLGEPFGWESKPGQPVTLIGTTSAFAQHGTRCMVFTLPTATAPAVIVRRFVWGLVVGRQYTASIYVRVPTGTANMAFGCDPGGTINVTINDAFQRRSITFTAVNPWCEVFLFNTTNSTAGQLVQVDAVQVEEGAAATAFELVGAVFSWRFTGDVNQWELTWQGGPGLKATCAVKATDRLAKLATIGEYRTILEEDVLDDFPVAYYPLTESEGSTTAGDLSGNSNPPMQIVQIGTGGAANFGWDHTDSLLDYAVPGWYRGKTTGLQLLPSALGTPITANYPTGKYLRGDLNTPITPGDGASVVVWAYYPSAGASAFGPLAFLTAADGSYLGVHKDGGTGNFTAVYVNNSDSGIATVVTTPNGLNFVGQFAAVLSVPSAGNGELKYYLNGDLIGTSGSFAMVNMPQWNQTTVGGRDKTVDGVVRANLSHAQFYDYAIGQAVLQMQTSIGVFGSTGLQTTAQMLKLAQFRGLQPINVITKSPDTPSQAMFMGAQEIDGDPLDAIHAVERVEDGLFYIAGDGQRNFQLRSWRYNAVPLMDLDADMVSNKVRFRGDDFGLVNDVTGTSPGGATQRYINTASVAAHGRRKKSFDAPTGTDEDMRDLVQWQANGFGTQRNRITNVTISLLNHPGVIAAALTIEPSSKITIDGLPAQAPAAAVELFVEGWEEVISEDEWSMSFNTSPAEPWNVWQLGVAGRSELGVTTWLGH
jgi:hypothetical protein